MIGAMNELTNDPNQALLKNEMPLQDDMRQFIDVLDLANEIVQLFLLCFIKHDLARPTSRNLSQRRPLQHGVCRQIVGALGVAQLRPG
jgi:hypothetical protein